LLVPNHSKAALPKWAERTLLCGEAFFFSRQSVMQATYFLITIIIHESESQHQKRTFHRLNCTSNTNILCATKPFTLDVLAAQAGY